MPNMRAVFQQVMQRWGTNVYLQRKDYSLPGTGPYKDKTNHGYGPSVELWTVRMHLPGRGSTRLPSTRSEQQEGIVTNVDLIFYFPWDANVKEQDRIYVIDERYNIPGSTDYSGHEMYIVTYAAPMRGLGGRTEFWEAGGQRKSPN